MPRPIAHSASVPAPVDKVHAALVSEQYWKDRIQEIGGPSAHLVSVTAINGTISVVMTQSIPEEELPAAVTAFKKGALVIERTESWGPLGGGRAEGKFGATVEGAPATISGTTLLEGNDTSSTMSLSGNTEVKVPIFGGKIEAMISEQVLSLIDNEHDFTGNWVGQNLQ
ncbi:MAG: DUF2505 domain-containing protein [Rhodococcus sp. (in: high G+C Gram-positive bacteria)]|jgi:hypothetical protein|uniref:DUF2505 domain-containing protein n=1 Tax=Rhodococcus sp. EPR-157 TaxID=1813677 RepID=UPI0007BBC1AB|nr:DUF2505 domain-containing protein [Rhodococcus sp. EPR-157]KZF00224.1 hypothetical protein A2J03_11710 [Rhodococcus sp. EPR-157]